MAKTTKNLLVAVSGERDIDRALRRFERVSQRKYIRQATRASTKEIVLPDAINRVTVDTGRLKKSLKVRAIKRSRKRIGHQVQTGEDARAFSGEAYYGQFVELGTVRHKAQPFLRPALYENRNEIRAAFVKHLRAAIADAGRQTKKG